MFSRSTFFAAVAASTMGALVAFLPATAHATVLSACGNIDLSGDETCTFETSGGCQAQCTPVNVDVSCSAQLEASCSGGCTGSIDANCSATCVSSCTGGCSAGNFSCSGSCEADCSGHCQSQCSSDAHQDECTASCKETCGAHCDASCSGQPPSCTPVTCQAACQGSCQAQANFSCDITCQEMGYASCQSTVTGGCNAQCSQPQGALFCNGQYVNVDATQLQDCENQLQSLLNIQVSAAASCSGSTCTGQAAASCGQIAPGAMPMSEGFLAVGLGAGIIGAVRRRVKKAKKA
jgi:hypothetical protein